MLLAIYRTYYRAPPSAEEVAAFAEVSPRPSPSPSPSPSPNPNPSPNQARKKLSNPKPPPNSNPNPSLALTPNLTLTLPGTQEVLARPVPADRQLGGLVEPLLIPILSLTQTRTRTPTN